CCRVDPSQGLRKRDQFQLQGAQLGSYGRMGFLERTLSYGRFFFHDFAQCEPAEIRMEIFSGKGEDIRLLGKCKG
ncbi:MAG: hypothetical protein D3909_11325, partial [Candidatus Electrothrix sp. ATG1]|nr:hypothetical protein [Candidatus Electrothrix sp. ATG1]